jgi:hypothetical protein
MKTLGASWEHLVNILKTKFPKNKRKNKAPMNLLIGSGTVCLHFQPGLIPHFPPLPPPKYELGVVIVSVHPLHVFAYFT